MTLLAKRVKLAKRVNYCRLYGIRNMELTTGKYAHFVKYAHFCTFMLIMLDSSLARADP